MKTTDLINYIQVVNALENNKNLDLREQKIVDEATDTINIQIATLTNFIKDNEFTVYKNDLQKLEQAEAENNTLLYIYVLYNIILKNIKVYYKALNKHI
jgi:hypothetical protein